MKLSVSWLVFVASSVGANLAAAPFEFLRDGTNSVSLRENGRPVYTFQLAPRSRDGEFARANYLHPVYDLGGRVLTEDFPADHPHHRGIFWAWHQILVEGRPVADSWVCRDLKWLPSWTVALSEGTAVAADRARLEVIREWAVGDAEQRVVREYVEVIVHPTDPVRGRRMDFTIRLRALVDGVTLGGSNDDKGYGGFAPRIRLTDDVHFTGREGAVKPVKTAVEAGPWLDMTETLEGKFIGMTMMVHPGHPGFPLKWILRAKRSMQNPQWPGREPVPLSMRRDTVLRYRLLFHERRLERNELEDEWFRYADSYKSATIQTKEAVSRAAPSPNESAER